MRTLPPELLNKLQEQFQVENRNAKPNLRLVATQSTINTLLSENIHKNITADYGDVAIRQLSVESSPSLVYAVCIYNGIAHIYERLLPAELEKPWTQLFSIGEATECAIEFNGTWKLNSKKQWYSLETEQTPYIFWVDTSSILYVQKWDDTSTKTPLAENVSCISVCRGWQSSDDSTLDQGLIIGYLKNSAVCYRAFCLQSDGTHQWETEQVISELGTGNTSLCLFRTNDYRVGFITENNGIIKYTLSKRTYAGGSVAPETVYSQVGECSLSCFQVYFTEAFVEPDTVGAIFPVSDCIIEYYKEYPTLSVSSTDRISSKQLQITLNHPIVVSGNLADYIAISPARTITSVIANNNIITITTEEVFSSGAAITVTISGGNNIRYHGTETSFIIAPNLTATFAPESVQDDDPGIMALPIINTLANLKVNYITNSYTENLSLTTSFTVTLTTTMVGSIPI
ncbi:MAG: hypothetical protein A2Y17_11155 [Clostridiales bacterium GWF2_38_85]|nr:MAG: hypothetical protein A2Y17_11155 [Clostridiales bacterium GWF2_38_85]HBL84683.1 hypothetical protein [Clostridiales bacterium]